MRKGLGSAYQEIVQLSRGTITSRKNKSRKLNMNNTGHITNLEMNSNEP